MRATLLSILIYAVATVPLHAEKPAEPKAQPVDTFLLTDKAFEKYRNATSNLIASAAKIKKAMPRDMKSDDDSSEGVITMIAEQCEKISEFKKAVAKAELSCREYAVTNIVLMQASVLSFGVEREGEAFYKRMPQATKTLRANVKFAIDNKATIEKLNAEQRKAFE